MRFWAFCALEACVGMCYPVQGMLKGTLISNKHCATVNLFTPVYNVKLVDWDNDGIWLVIDSVPRPTQHICCGLPRDRCILCLACSTSATSRPPRWIISLWSALATLQCLSANSPVLSIPFLLPCHLLPCPLSWWLWDTPAVAVLRLRRIWLSWGGRQYDHMMWCVYRTLGLC